MKKIWRLRRQGVLLMTLGVGVYLGRADIPYMNLLLVMAVIMWLLIYDFAMEGWCGKNVSSSRTKKSKTLHERENEC